jgi:peptidoglycan/LPS O-acetylase OafA/YrhL
MPATTTRLTGIDGVRGVAIFMVIAGHLIGFAGLLGRSEVYSELFKTPLHVLWDERAAVQIFFVLSGFVLQRGVHQQMSSTLAYRFLITRFFRLYPLYAIALALMSHTRSERSRVPGRYRSFDRCVRSGWPAT